LLRDYPEEFDDYCEVCTLPVGNGLSGGNECSCPECPVCTEVGNPECYGTHIPKGNRAFNLSDLAKHLGANREDEASISKRLFKDTRCGISFHVDQGGPRVSVAGYAEGAGDAYCEPIRLTFPIDLGEFDAAVERADQEGCDLYDESHCPNCGTETDYLEVCEEDEG